MNLEEGGNTDPPSSHDISSDNTRELADITYRWDRLRGVGQGVVETCWSVFALLIAIRVFNAEESIKQIIPMGMGIGFLLSPWGLSLLNRVPRPITRLLALIWLCVAVCLFGMAIAPSIGIFVLFVTVGQIFASQGIPMMTHVYSRNYLPTQRGTRLSTTFLIASFSGILFGFAGGKILDWKEAAYPMIFLCGVAAALLFAWSSVRIPSGPARSLQSGNARLSLIQSWQDNLFRWMLIAWMLTGLGNLMLIPIRVEYLANPDYGINATNFEISTLLISVVLIFRLLSTKIWGRLFDRINVVTLRIVLNMVAMAGIIVFFYTDKLWLMGIGCALMGISMGGGQILWTLYVTKIAPPERISSYMSVHSFMTGVRMALAPMIGYGVVRIAHPVAAAWIAICLIGISNLLFLPLKPRIEKIAKNLDHPFQQRFSPTNRA